MIKRISIILVLTLVLTLCAACSAAPTKIEETIHYDDGSYLVITTVASGRMTTSVIEDTAEVMPQSNQSQEGYVYYSLSHESNQEDAENEIKRRESFDTSGARHFVTWIKKDGMLIPVRVGINGLPLYDSEIATKYCSYYSADDRLLWTMSLTGIFRKNVIDRHCDIVSSNIKVYEQDSWYIIAEEEQTDIDDVSYTVRFGRKNLCATIAEPTYTITLSRDETGNFH